MSWGGNEKTHEIEMLGMGKEADADLSTMRWGRIVRVKLNRIGGDLKGRREERCRLQLPVLRRRGRGRLMLGGGNVEWVRRHE